MIIYTATNKITGKVYVGLTRQTLKVRKAQHYSNAHKVTTHFAYALIKYKKSDWEWKVVARCNDAHELGMMEKHFIDYLMSFENGYNSTTGGDGNWELTEEVRQKMSKAKKKVCPLPPYTRLPDDYFATKVRYGRNVHGGLWFCHLKQGKTRSRLSTGEWCFGRAVREARQLAQMFSQRKELPKGRRKDKPVGPAFRAAAKERTNRPEVKEKLRAVCIEQNKRRTRDSKGRWKKGWA